MSSTDGEPNTAPAASQQENAATSSAEHERLYLALSSARMGTWDWQIGANAMQWDEQMHALFGLQNGAFSGRYEDFLNLLHVEDRERVTQEMKAALSTCSDYDGEFRVTCAGNLRMLRARSKVHCSESGEPDRMVGVCWDITERRRTEENLARQSSLLRALMDHLPDHIYFKDLESRFVLINRQMAARRGVEAGSMIGKTDFDFFTEEHARAAFEDERKVIETGESLVGLVEKETWPDGRVTWVSTTKLPLRDEQGRIIGTFGLSRDVTERKLAEEQLARFAEELRIKNEALEEELSMARELQNAMLPQRYPRFPRDARAGESAARFYHIYQPSAAVSGDFFDIFEIEQNIAGLFICDVMGHGVRAALVAATMRALVGELSAAWHDPAEFLMQLNQALRRTLRHARTPLFATAFYMVADLARGELRYANAGHPMPLCIHHPRQNAEPATGQNAPEKNPAEEIPPAGMRPLNGCKPGPVLGLFDDVKYTSCAAAVNPHDTVLLFTDGLFEVEGKDDQFYDYAKLLEAVSKRSNLSIAQLCRGVIEEVQAFSASHEFSDDVCLVAMQIKRLTTQADHPRQ